MRRPKWSYLNRGVVALAAAAGLVMWAAGPASAAPGAGAFTGFEDAPANSIFLPSALCAEYTPTAAAPLVETLALTGVPSGTAIFTDTSTNYDANPLGTWSDTPPPYPVTGCTGVPFAVPGNMTVTEPGVSCTGPATYLRTLTSVVVIQYTSAPSCTSGSIATMVLTGVEAPCVGPVDPCPVLGHDAILAGAWVQT